jgi:hypothetical protein
VVEELPGSGLLEPELQMVTTGLPNGGPVFCPTQVERESVECYRSEPREIRPLPLLHWEA